MRESAIKHKHINMKIIYFYNFHHWFRISFLLPAQICQDRLQIAAPWHVDEMVKSPFWHGTTFSEGRIRSSHWWRKDTSHTFRKVPNKPELPFTASLRWWKITDKWEPSVRQDCRCNFIVRLFLWLLTTSESSIQLTLYQSPRYVSRASS